MFEADAGNYRTVIDWRQRRYEMNAGTSQSGAIGEYRASEKLKSSSWSWHLSSNGRDAGEARHLALESICRWYDGHQAGASEALEDRSFMPTQVRNRLAKTSAVGSLATLPGRAGLLANTGV